jgi:hypothetical protein
MQCKPIIIWRPVPDGSFFRACVKGDESVFNVQMDIESSGKPTKKFTQAQLVKCPTAVPSPALVPINKGDHFLFDLVLNITSDPPADKPVILDLRIVDKNNNIVQVGDGMGGTRPAQCTSQFTKATGTKPVGIVVVAVAVK